MSRHRNLWEEIRAIQQEMARDAEEGAAPMGAGDTFFCNDWTPPADIFDLGDRFLVRVEAPGLNKENIKIEIERNLLTVTGKREKRADEEDARLIRSERRCGTFQRSFRLPPNVLRESIKAVMNDGILDIYLPKPEEAKPKQVQITVE